MDQIAKEFTTKAMTDLLYNDLSDIIDDNENETEVVLTTPTIESVFPCRLVNNPLDSILKSENAIPLMKDFKIIIEHWAAKQSICVEMCSNTDKVLQKRNMLRTNTQPIVFDEIVQKYKLITSYEVRWNAITNTFEYIK